MKNISLISGGSGSSAGINSTLRLEDIDTGERFCFKLVDAGDPEHGSEQVLMGSSLGRALCGQKTGAVIHWQAPSGLRRFILKSVC